ncbi:MAG: hypothetical protein R3B53_01940 [Candidatus Paceibacterota bacterium]
MSTNCDASGDFTTAYDSIWPSIYSLTIDSVNGVLYAGSGNGGIIYRCLLSTACDASGDFTVAYDTSEIFIQSLSSILSTASSTPVLVVVVLSTAVTLVLLVMLLVTSQSLTILQKLIHRLPHHRIRQRRPLRRFW